MRNAKNGWQRTSRCFACSTRTFARSLRSSGLGAPYEFICECSTSGCFERLSLTLDEYERVRQDGTHFLLADGHEDIEIEQVIAHGDEYVVVEKDGVAGIVAEDDDPRA